MDIAKFAGLERNTDFYEKIIQRHTGGRSPWIYPAGVNSAGGVLDLPDMSFFNYQFYRLGLYVSVFSIILKNYFKILDFMKHYGIRCYLVPVH